MRKPRRKFFLAVPALAYVLLFGFNPGRGSAAPHPQTSPPPEIHIEVYGCSPAPPDYWCFEIPSLIVTLQPMPEGEDLPAIAGEYNGHPFSCPGNSCLLPLAPTSQEGVRMEFWIVSATGAISNHISGRVRVLAYSGLPSARNQGYRVEIASSQIDPGFEQCCASLWEALPPLEDIPQWLSAPASTSELWTEDPYYFLAGRLIKVGYVDASICSEYGLQPNFYATECGLTVAFGQVIEWQNQFDASILRTANQTGVPAWVLKRLFAQESQFWPGNFGDTSEFGLGHLTPLGADTLFLWNPEFYDQFCVSQYGEEGRCYLNYYELNDWEQGQLRALLVHKSSAACEGCEYGLDLTDIDDSIEIIALTLKANAAQTAHILWLTTGSAPGTLSDYQDLWRFTLANYNAGPGCLSEAIKAAQAEDLEINWENVAGQLIGDCQNAVEYVEDITRE